MIFDFLDSQEIGNAEQLKEQARLEGTNVVLSRDGSRIITVYRNRSPARTAQD